MCTCRTECCPCDPVSYRNVACILVFDTLLTQTELHVSDEFTEWAKKEADRLDSPNYAPGIGFPKKILFAFRCLSTGLFKT